MVKLFSVGLLLLAGAGTGAAESRVAKDLRPQIGELEKKAVALVEAMPEEKMGWAPAGARSFRAAALHMAYGNYLLLNFTKGRTPGREDIQNKISQHAKYEQAEASKAEVVKSLRESFAAVRAALDSKSEEELAQTVDFFGQEKSTGGMFAVIAEHASEHLGQMIAYARMCGVKPPWSR
jgi:uncharacterized damage-inducible protein DinB